MNEILVDEWVGCYSGGWKGVIVDGAFSHPAKVAFSLAKKIYEHAIEEGWIVAGDTVVDPFGGIGGCAFHGLMSGMRVVTCELEQKFVDLAKENRELWRQRFTGLPGFDADNWIILQGDSRKLASVIREARIAVSSPPYTPEALGHRGAGTDIDRTKGLHARCNDNQYGESDGQLSQMQTGDLTLAVSSPPYASGEKGHPSLGSVNNDDWGHDGRDITRRRGKTGEYGSTEGSIAAMPEGSLCVSSPPFPQPYSSGGGINVKGYGDGSDKVGDRTYQSQGGDRAEGNLETLENKGFDVAISSPPYNPPMSQDHNGSRGGKRGTEPSETGAFVKYGTSEGQIEGLSMEGFDCAVSSPPYENAVSSGRDGIDFAKAGRPDKMLSEGYKKNYRIGAGAQGDYAYNKQNPDNVGNQSGDTFWSASRTILEQLYSVLTPGAHAIFIVKMFCRDKKLVDFPGQWAALCQAVGFVWLHDHHALLAEDYGTQITLDGGEDTKRIKRISFFRRLHEKKNPDTAIEWENVLCFERP